MLIGEPGVGKTAIAEGLAMRIVAGERVGVGGLVELSGRYMDSTMVVGEGRDLGENRCLSWMRCNGGVVCPWCCSSPRSPPLGGRFASGRHGGPQES